MTDAQSTSKPTVGQRAFGEFSWPGGRIPPALAGRPIPVKIGAIDEIKALLPPEEHEAVQSALARWTRGAPYVHAILEEGARRVDLEGNPVEEVTAGQRNHALGRLDQMQISKARRQRAEVMAALDAIDRVLAEPTSENLAAAKKGFAQIRGILGPK